MEQNRKRQLASTDSVVVKINRAKFHLEAFHDAMLDSGAEDISRFITVKIRKDGRTHVYRVNHPSAVDPRLSAIVGDCIHNLRSALDHLACALVLARFGHQPNWRTQFPVCERRPRGHGLNRLRRKAGVSVRGGVAAEPLSIIESVQPYNGSDEGRTLLALHKLDLWDKHRQLLLVAHAYGGMIRHLVDMSDPNAPPTPHVRFTGAPFEHNEIMAVVTYERAYDEPHPNLEFGSFISFDRRTPNVGGGIVGIILEEFVELVETNLFRRCAPYLPDASVPLAPPPTWRQPGWSPSELPFGS
jgi:hypothetical protein